jgi:hypothetical protein
MLTQSCYEGLVTTVRLLCPPRNLIIPPFRQKFYSGTLVQTRFVIYDLATAEDLNIDEPKIRQLLAPPDLQVRQASLLPSFTSLPDGSRLGSRWERSAFYDELQSLGASKPKLAGALRCLIRKLRLGVSGQPTFADLWSQKEKGVHP